MKTFGNTITLVKNGRGCYILDTVKGCSVCAKQKPLGCYGDCYAQRIASRYGIDFSIPVRRCFTGYKQQFSLFGDYENHHVDVILNQIKHISMPFVRIGDMGDPSQFWEHTINICKTIARAGKPIVIITKHWKPIPDYLLSEIHGLDLYINTSISPLDSSSELEYRLAQYQRLKNYCHSVLRIVSCDFNTDNTTGKKLYSIQNKLFDKYRFIDTIFRPGPSNILLQQGIINADKMQFLGSKVLASMYNKQAYFGCCSHCPDMCGLTMHE